MTLFFFVVRQHPRPRGQAVILMVVLRTLLLRLKQKVIKKVNMMKYRTIILFSFMMNKP